MTVIPGPSSDSTDDLDPLLAPSEHATPVGRPPVVPPGRGFLWWGVGADLAVTAVLLAASLRVTGGRLVYLIDDPAIHLSIASTLAESGTWGVNPGEFQSASSAPAWTALLALVALVAPFAATAAPLVLNAAASIGLIAVLGADQRFLRPGRDRPLDGPAVAAIVVVVLMLPALTLLGMEHVLHMLLCVAVLVLLWPSSPQTDRRAPAAYLLLGVAALVRFETVFLAVGIAVAALLVRTDDDDQPFVVRARRAALALAAAGVPVVAFATFNRLMGQGWLPNSVLAKSPVTSGDATMSVTVVDVLHRFTTDPLLAGLGIAVLVALIVGWRRCRYQFVAVALLVAVALHVSVADVGWYDRYQGYLIAVAVLVLLRVGGESPLAPDTSGAAGASGPPRRVLRPAVLVLSVLLLGATKAELTWNVPRAVADTYQQRYQAGVFLDRYYPDDSIATGELGYISLLHDGPITDLYGLADVEVLEQRRAGGERVDPDFWRELVAARDIEVVAMYPTTLFLDTPQEWILVGTWTLEHSVVTAYDEDFQFWVTHPDGVDPLQQHLSDFADQLPDGVELRLDEFADLRAGELSGG